MTGLTPPAPVGYDPARAHNIQSFIPGPEEHFPLPEGVTKASAMATITACLRLLGAKEREIAVWRHIADTTERAAWTGGPLPPLNWRRQCDMAREMGLCERQWRNIERALERYGVLARATADNGYRGHRAGSSYARPRRAGLSLAPALANYGACVARLAEADVLEAQRQEHLLHARVAQRRIAALIAGLSAREVWHWASGALGTVEAEHRPKAPRTAAAAEISAWHAALLDLEDRIREAMAPLPVSRPADPDPDQGLSEKPVEEPSRRIEKQQEISGAPEMEARRHIQPEYNLNSLCNAQGPSERTPAYAGDRSLSGPPPDGGGHCEEKKDAGRNDIINPRILEKLTPERIRALASDDAGLYLDALQDWNEAVPMILRELGINISAWFDACDAMGPPLAFLALIIIDRNRFHPHAPVRSPGGALRAFTDRAERGDLNLTRAVLGIWERERQGQQPKAHPAHKINLM